MQFGVGRGIHTPAGSAQNRQGSHASVSEITVTKQLDKSTIGVLEDLLGGDLHTKVVICMTHTDKGNAKYLEFELEKTGISGYSISTGGERPTESISLNFVKFKVTDHEASHDGKTHKPKHTIYDIGLMKLNP